MLKAFFNWFTGRSSSEVQAPAPQAEPAPYKVEAPEPAPVKCGCGRSATGFCVGLHRLPASEWAVHPDNPERSEPVAEVAPVVEPAPAPAAKKAPAKKPAAKPAVIKGAGRPRAR